MDGHLARLNRQRKGDSGSVELFEAHRKAQLRAGLDLDFDLPPAASYRVLPRADTYGKGLQQLQNDCDEHDCDKQELYQPSIVIEGKRLIRPETFEEGIEALVRGDKELWGKWFFTSDAIEYKGGTTLFTIKSKDKRLITISEGFRQHYLHKAYTPQDRIELDSSDGSYNRLLEEHEVMEHEGLRQVVPNEKLREQWKSFVYDEKNKKISMRVIQNPEEDQVRAVALSTDDYSLVVGVNDLDSDALFLRVAPKEYSP